MRGIGRPTCLTSRSGQVIVRNRRKRIDPQTGRRCRDAAAVPECAKLEISHKKKLFNLFQDTMNSSVFQRSNAGYAITPIAGYDGWECRRDDHQQAFCLHGWRLMITMMMELMVRSRCRIRTILAAVTQHAITTRARIGTRLLFPATSTTVQTWVRRTRINHYNTTITRWPLIPQESAVSVQS